MTVITELKNELKYLDSLYVKIATSNHSERNVLDLCIVVDRVRKLNEQLTTLEKAYA